MSAVISLHGLPMIIKARPTAQLTLAPSKRKQAQALMCGLSKSFVATASLCFNSAVLRGCTPGVAAVRRPPFWGSDQPDQLFNRRHLRHDYEAALVRDKASTTICTCEPAP